VAREPLPARDESHLSACWREVSVMRQAA
jgi:hypothetical protein